MGHSPAQGRDVYGYLGALLKQLAALHPREMDFSLKRFRALLAAFDNPQEKLGTVIHIAGTNGKGSTTALIASMARAQGLKVNAMTSPHLVHIEERFLLGGHFVRRAQLIEILEEIQRVNGTHQVTIFEILTVAGFLLFSRHKADICIIEVGLGGRLDATNVIAHPTLCLITPISRDHETFLGHDLASIAEEKAGIFKTGVPAISAAQSPVVASTLRRCAQKKEAPLYFVEPPIDVRGAQQDSFSVVLPWGGEVVLPVPALRGVWQLGNAALAYCALRFVLGDLSGEAARRGLREVVWPGRLHQLKGRLATYLPKDWTLWLDGGHNEGAAKALAQQFVHWGEQRPLYLLIGMKEGKGVASFMKILAPYASEIWVVHEDGQYQALSTTALQKKAPCSVEKGGDLLQTLTALVARHKDVSRARVVICGSLYLAGIALERDGCAFG